MVPKAWLERYTSLFTRPSSESFHNYLSALTGEMRSFSVLGFTNLYDLPYDKHDYFISRGIWNERTLNRVRVGLHLEAGQKKVFDLILDDSSIRKFTSVPFFVAKGYIGNLGKVDQCFSSVFSCLSNGQQVIPLDFDPYLPASKLLGGHKDAEFRSKLQLAASQVHRAFFMAQEIGFQIDCCLFDTWYNASWFLDSLTRGHVKYMTEIRPNRVIETCPPNRGRREEGVAVKSFVTANNRNPALIVHDEELYQVRSYVVNLRGMGHPVKLFVVRGRFCGQKQTRFFITNDLGMDEEEGLRHILLRWDIDYFFREAKAYLALDEGKFQKLSCYVRHFYLCLVAYSVIQQHKKRGELAEAHTTFQVVRWLRKGAG